MSALVAGLMFFVVPFASEKLADKVWALVRPHVLKFFNKMMMRLAQDVFRNLFLKTV